MAGARKVPKTGPAGRLYDQCHLAWRAGLISRWRVGAWGVKNDPAPFKDRVWSIDLGDGEGWRHDIARDDCAELVAARITSQGVQSMEWGASWVGFRTVIVTVHGHAVESRRPGARASLAVVS